MLMFNCVVKGHFKIQCIRVQDFNQYLQRESWAFNVFQVHVLKYNHGCGYIVVTCA